MKKLLLLTIALPLLGACDDSSSYSGITRNNQHQPSVRMGYFVDSTTKGSSYVDLGVWTDTETGCEYFTGEVHGGIMMSPRIGVDRQPICNKEKSSDYQKYLDMKKRFESTP